MSEKYEMPPDPDQTDEEFTSLDEKTFLHLLASSGVSELLTNDDKPSFVAIDSTPKDKGVLYLNPDGESVYGFMTKFSEGFTGWKRGDLVRARYVMNYKQGDTSLLVADSFVGDIRYADEFEIEGDPEMLEQLQGLGIAEADLDLEVTSEEGEYVISETFRYSARVDRVNNVMQPWDGKSELEPGKVLLQGTVSEYVHDEDNSYTIEKPTYMTLDVNGTPVVVNLNGGYLRCEGSRDYEHLLNQAPEPGDVVQVLTSYNPVFEQKSYSKPRVSPFDASWCRSTFCLEANPDRAAQQEAFHESVELLVGELADLTDPAEFRTKYGEIIDLVFVETGGPIRDCRTKAQKQRMSELVEEMFPEKEDHMRKPLLAVSTDFPSVLSKLKSEYELDLYAMSVEEAYQAIEEIADNPTKLRPHIADTSCPLRVLKHSVSPEQMSILAAKMVETYHPLSVRQKASHARENFVPEPGVVPYNMRSITEGAILYLGVSGERRDSDTLLELFETSVADDLFAHDRAEISYTSAIVDALSHSLETAAKWSANDSSWTVHDIPKINYFTQEVVPRLVKAMGTYTRKVQALLKQNEEAEPEISHAITLSRLESLVEFADKLYAAAAEQQG